MLNGSALSLAYAAMAVFAIAGWLLSLAKRDVSIVDSLWSLFFLLGLGVYVCASEVAPRTALLVVLVSLWALRLSIYLTWRNWGEPEDHRYQVIRARNEPNFSVKSVYLIFGFQVVLAGIIAFPLFTAASSPAPLGFGDYLGIALWLIGMVFEVVGDWQLARFKSNPMQKGRVLNTGLWRYTRHPNYFGETALWWGYYAIALSAGAWWTVFAPLLMTLLLLKVSGVALLEKDIGERRPAYADYVRRTNAFLPWFPKDAP
jgi:steroid 5-alpha reductase family enzyme